jgi:hypothetical protein
VGSPRSVSGFFHGLKIWLQEGRGIKKMTGDIQETQAV